MKKILFVSAIAFLLIAGCAPSAQEKEAKEKAKADSIVSEQMLQSSAGKSQTDSVISVTSNNTQKDQSAKSDKKKREVKKSEKPAIKQTEAPQAWDSAFVRRNSSRRLIKVADLVFAVADVARTTGKIEYIANVYGGFVLASGIKATVTQNSLQRINKDTILETGIKSIENNMTVRVPEFLLDTVLFKLSKLWTDLNERSVNAQDVTIDFMANELRARMYEKTALNINQAAQNNQRKLDNVVDAQKAAADYLESTIQKKIANLTLQDKIDYATITLRFYQDNVLYKKKRVSYEMEQYEPGFGTEFVHSLNIGWKIILGFILFITKCWSILLIMLCLFLAIYLPIRYFVKRKKRKSAGRNQ